MTENWKARALAAESSLSEAVKAAYQDAALIAERTTVAANGHPQIDAPTPADMRNAIASTIRARAVVDSE